MSAVAVALTGIPVHGQGTGSVQGTVTFTDGGAAVHGAVVLVVGPGLVALTAENGEFEIENVPAGTYEILAQREHLTAARQTITSSPQTDLSRTGATSSTSRKGLIPIVPRMAEDSMP